MSFAVVRMAKMKSHDLKGIQIHNQRERESKTNPDIDPDRMHLNYDLLNSTKIDYNRKVKEIIESQREGTRKIRKDAVLVNELLVTSDKKFFDGLKPEEQKRFFQESYKLFSERYGKDNIAYSTVHYDERTPHMHIGVVPMRDGKLQGKNIFNRQELQWMQDEFPKHMQSLGFDVQRGEKSDRKHIEMQRFKAMTLKKELEILQQDHETLQKDVQGYLEAVKGVKALDDLEIAQKGLFGRQSVRMSVEDFETVKALARASEGLKIENKDLRLNAGLQKASNVDLKMENEKLKTENGQLKQENADLKTENRNLEQQVSQYKKIVEYLTQVLEMVKKNSERFLGVALDRMKDYVGELRLHALTQKFGPEQSFAPENIKGFIPEDERSGAERYMAKVERLEKAPEAEERRGPEKQDAELER